MDPAPSCLFYASPLGWLRIEAGDDAVTGVWFCSRREGRDRPGPLARAAQEQLAEYFEGARRTFTLPLQPQGSPFQRQVWAAMQGIPYGHTRSYKSIAAALGDAGALRAVGQASGQNPLPILIPCHRVVGSDGALRGYGGGRWRKEWLLRHEGWLPRQTALFPPA